MYKRGSSKLSPRERRKLNGDWWGKVRIGERRYKQVRLCRDSQVSERWLRELSIAVDRKEAGEAPQAERLKGIPRRLLESLGLVSKLAEARRAPWSQHVDDYIRELRTAGCDKVYVDNARLFLVKVGEACNWASLEDVDRDDFQHFIETQVAAEKSPRTINNIRATLVGFMNWAVRVRRSDRNELATVRRVNVAGDRRRVRRAFRHEEAIRLLRIAGRRELCYRLALATGLRRKELSRLQWRDIRIDGDDAVRPHIQLRAEATKSKRADWIPLKRSIAERLRAARPADFKQTDLVFASVPTDKTWKRDLVRAGLVFRDDANTILGFHSMRVTVSTNLRVAGRPQTETDAIMRHRPRDIGSQSYTDLQAFDLFAAIECLPDYAPSESGGSTVKAARASA